MEVPKRCLTTILKAYAETLGSLKKETKVLMLCTLTLSNSTCHKGWKLEHFICC